MNPPTNNSKKIYLSIFAVIFIALLGWILLKTKNPSNESNDWQAHDEKLKMLDQKMQEISTQIKSNAGKGKCRDDSHCRVAGLGAKTCDGYSNFLIYSTQDTSEIELLNLVEEFNNQDELYNELSMKVTNCGEKPLPIHCINNLCTTKTN